MIKRFKNGITFLLENSLFLIVGSVVALMMANLAPEIYHEIVHTEIFAHVSLHYFVNDVAMTMFFLLAAKEIRESMLPGGDLSTFKTAGLPIMATIGGMLFPAAIYFTGAKLLAPELVRGTAIPMATDIAFSYLVAKMIFRRRADGKMPAPIVFLLLLAIADDAGGLIILAVFYPQADMNLLMFALLVGASLIMAGLLRRQRVNSFWPYLVFCGPASWIGFYLGGIHPALSLVPLAWVMPHEHTDMGLWAVGESNGDDTLNKLQKWWESPVELILCLFGFCNAGVRFSSVGIGTWLVLAGLIVGKPVGIVLMTKLGQFLGFSMPKGMGNRELVVVGCAAAIGFTVALFVSVVAFPNGAIQDSVKMGALLSFGAALLTILVAQALKVGNIRDKE